MNDRKQSADALCLAEAVRAACIEAARKGFADAGMAGLCRDGTIEAAIGAMEMVDLQAVLNPKAD
ncbi:MAG: acetyltransferase [Pseudomonadales bacterium]|nr:acetyltransferase [Pseudomonadales bacterium]